MISALSFAIELTDGAMSGHALRSCLLGMRIAEEAGFTPEEKSSLYYALLLKDIGNEEMIGLRCDRGASIVEQAGHGIAGRRCSGPPRGALGWLRISESRMRGRNIPRLARIGAIAQHLDMFSIGRNTAIAVETMEEWSGSWFDPELVRGRADARPKGYVVDTLPSD